MTGRAADSAAVPPGYYYPIDPMPDDIVALRDSRDPVWIFAYGSLMWNPEFPFAEARPALLRGYHRSFCLYSREYRGTPACPGLVLGLDRGGACRGIAYRLASESLADTIDRIWAREMTGFVYAMRRLPLRIETGTISGYAFTVRRDAPDYAGRLPPERVAQIVSIAQGCRGSGRDYLANTVAHLDTLGIRDPALHRLNAQLDMLAAGAAAS